MHIAHSRAHCNALKPAAVATAKMQLADLTAGQFDGEWLVCLQRTAQVGNLLVKRVVDAMKSKEGHFMNCDVFLPAMFMEPRYKSLLTMEQKKKAMVYLHALHIRIENLCPELDAEETFLEEWSNNEAEEDLLETLLKSKETSNAKASAKAEGDL
ncbi:hypothetical protein FOCC_FOCC013933 [Frankliniella occidentalis]|nr:hypothetical protein FOCC_FOCC013933 [Frankliniella occidentalis]